MSVTPVLNVSYGSDARPADGGAAATSQLAHAGARLVPGAVAPSTFCSEMTEAGTACQGRPAKGTPMCAGHLRKNGLLTNDKD